MKGARQRRGGLCWVVGRSVLVGGRGGGRVKG
ncbi:unnamed protein product [Chondrus crispus]|uniref:Uncharacterized protein n=1 Tax=Chondrus crispus TaxID=2769 RepID=R7QR05_CHOCR|nr:unnamed protein product [Chondrus crispus]CDF39911.1 unnamed protein product [Chondrus crispus]|eukprot:XP_005710205.1 unnamed protein product [Chondrus crispus]